MAMDNESMAGIVDALHRKKLEMASAAERKRRQRADRTGDDCGYGKSRRQKWNEYGIDPLFSWPMFLAMLEVQNHECAVCGCMINESSHLDHDHATGRTRAILCKRCNIEVVGKLELGLHVRAMPGREVLISMARRYLIRHSSSVEVLV